LYWTTRAFSKPPGEIAIKLGNPTSLSRDSSFASLSIMLPLAKSPIKPFCTPEAYQLPTKTVLVTAHFEQISMLLD
jgi:hypothetical protein